MSNHTPGPWWYDKDVPAIRYQLPEGHPDRWDDDPEFDNGIRNVVYLGGAMGGLDTTADARLLTLAPELYDYVAEAAAKGCPKAQALIERLK